MLEINENVVYVKGAKNGAIYDFNTKNVWSINYDACEILERYIYNKSTTKDLEYISLLEQNKLVNKKFVCKSYIPKDMRQIELRLAWIEITDACNLKCVHCYEGETHVKMNDSLCLAEWKKIIDQLVELKIKTIIVIGGEPTCYKHVGEILKYISKFDVKSTLFTNATNISDELFNTIVETKTMVKTSVYGHTAELHDSITQVKGSFDKMVNNITRLKNAGIDITSSIIVMRENEQYVDEIIDFTKNLGMHFDKYDVIRNVFGGTQNVHSPISEKILKKAFRTKPNFSATKDYFDKAFFRNTCWYGKIAIKENGDVIPCEFERNLIYGNVKTNSLFDILNSKKLVENWFRDFSKIEYCKDCEFRFACKDCRPLGLSICGNINTKNPRCTYNPIDGVWNKK